MRGVEALCGRVIADLTRDAPIQDGIVVVALRLAPMPLLGAGTRDREASPA